MSKIYESMLFFNNVYVVDDFINEDLNKIKEKIIEIKNEDNGNHISNIGGWQSNNIIINEKRDDIFRDIETACIDHISEIYRLWEIFYQPVITSYWCNINKRHDFNLSHSHPRSIFSSVFYISCNDKSGDLVFERPDKFDDYFSGLSKINKYTFSEYSFTPQPGRMIFFPSYMRHYVKPNDSDSDRISMAFNFYVK